MIEATTLVAGIGNIFLGDDAFGVEVVRRLSTHPPRQSVRVVDFGIRGVDLAYTLLEGFKRIILVDAMPRGGMPGTLYVLEPDLSSLDAPDVALDGHGLVPAKVLSMVRAMGGCLDFIRIVGCEPGNIPDLDELHMGLSPPVLAAVDPAVKLIEQLLEVGDA